MSAIPGGAIGFTITGSASGPGGLNKVVDDAQKRIQKLAADTKRTKIDVPVRIDNRQLERDAATAKRIIRDVQQEANRVSAQSRVGIGGGFGGGGGRGGGRGGGAGIGGGGGLVAGGMEASKGISRAVRVGVVATAGLEAVEPAWNTLLAGLELMVGHTKKAASLAADAGDAAKDLPLLGNVIRPLSRFLGFITGINADIAKAEKDTKELDEKTARMEARNRQVGGVNAGFEAITEGEARRRATAGMSATQKEAFGVREQIKELDETRQKNRGRGFDETRFKEARAALVKRAGELEAQAAAEAAAKTEQVEGEHNDRIRAIQEQAYAEQLEAAGKHEEAMRARLILGHKQTQRELERDAQTAENRGDHGAAARLRAQAGAQAGLDAAEVAAHDRRVADKKAEEAEEKSRKRAEEIRREDDDFLRNLDKQERNRLRIEERGLQKELKELDDRGGGPMGRVVSNPMLTALSSPTARGDEEAKNQREKIIKRLEQIRDKQFEALTS